MSSESSVSTSSSSRIRQFGLYRTIDARTEEFLRLSRKRQIKHGCACAAISTAITVTVVVSVLLVYEYSINAGTGIDKSFVLRPNWLSLINDSADNIALDAKFANTKINFDRATLKLLPIILKALNQNRYLEKIIEDYASTSPTYDRRDTTEYTVKKNIFSNRNLAKVPISRLYTLEYKTSPVSHYAKSATNDLDFYAKVRKIRGHQGSIKKFNTLLRDKSRMSSSSHRPFTLTQASLSKKLLRSAKQISAKKKGRVSNDTSSAVSLPVSLDTKQLDKATYKSSCKCPKNLNYLLKRIVTSIQKLNSEKGSNKSDTTICTHDNNHKEDPKPLTFYPLTPVNVTKTSEINKNMLSTTTIPKVDPIVKNTSAPLFKDPSINDFLVKYIIPILQRSLISQKPKKPQILQGYPLVTSLHKPNYERYTNYDTNLKEEPTLINESVIQATDVEERLKTTTIPMTTSGVAKSVTQFSTNKHLLWDHREINTKKPLIEPYLEEDEDYKIETTKKPSLQDDLNKLDAHSIQLVKSSMISPQRINVENKMPRQKSSSKFVPIKNSTTRSKHPSHSLLALSKKQRNSSYVAFKNMITEVFTSYQHGNVTIPLNISYHHTEVNNLTNETLIPKNIGNIDFENIDKILLEDDVDKIIPDEELQEVEPARNNNTIFHGKLAAIAPLDIENPRKITSMLPMHRPLYLEIHRSDGRHDDNQEFDLNVNNIFDYNTK